MEKSSGISINLAKNRGESFVDRFVGFALTTGRLLVILTEGIALIAFIYRFSLDRTLVDLHDRITQNQAVVNLLKGNEALFRNLQDRLALAAALSKQSPQAPSYLTDIISFATPDMTIRSVDIGTDAIRIEAKVQSVDSLSNFVDKLKAYPPITSVSLDRIVNQTATDTITVNITAPLKQQKVIPGGQTQSSNNQNL